MIHDETKINELVKRVDDAERAIFDNPNMASTAISQDIISAMVDTRMVTYNASDKDELRSILANQRRVLEDIESRLRNLDAENDERVENVVDARMQRNAVVDQHQLNLLLSTHQSNLQQTVTDTLAAIGKEKVDVASSFAAERQKLVSHQQSLLTDVQAQQQAFTDSLTTFQKELKDKFTAELTAEYLSVKEKLDVQVEFTAELTAEYLSAKQQLDAKVATIHTQLQQPPLTLQTQPSVPNQIDVQDQPDGTKSTSSSKSREPEGAHISATKPVQDDSSHSSEHTQMTSSRLAPGGIRPRKYPHPKRELEDAELTALSYCEHEESEQEEEHQREIYHREQYYRNLHKDFQQEHPPQRFAQAAATQRAIDRGERPPVNHRSGFFGGRFADRSPGRGRGHNPNSGSGGTRRIHNGNLQRSQSTYPRDSVPNVLRSMSSFNDGPGNDGWYPGDEAPESSSHGDTDANSALLAGIPPDALEYLMGENGVDELTMQHFEDLGFLKPAASYTSIKGRHRQLMHNYTVQSQYGYSDGPKNIQLLSSGAPFKKLESLKPTIVMEWYKNLVSVLTHYNICLTPFKDIVLKYGEMALCLPGVGWMKYNEMGIALGVLLTTNLLPLEDDSILPKRLAQKLRLANKSNNGYKILHRLLEEVIVGYKLDSLEMTWPRYRTYECVFAFAEHMMLTYELAQKHEFNPTAFQLARLYLDSIKKEAGDKLKMAALILENDLKKLDKKAAIPETFELDHLAFALSESIEEADDTDLLRKQVYHTTIPAPSSTSTSATTAFSSLTSEPTPNQTKEKHVQFIPTPKPSHLPPSSPNEHIQGYSLRKYYANEVYRKNGRSRQQSRPAPNPRRLTRNRRRRPYDPAKRCNACNRVGHDANSCDHLGVSCFIERFRADGANEDVIRQAEEAWIQQNNQYLVQPPAGDDRTPSQVLRNYMDKYGFDFETVEDEMDWIYFGNDCQDGDDVEEDAIDIGNLSLS
jgi:hypothetical protein